MIVSVVSVLRGVTWLLDSDCLVGMIFNFIESGVFYCTIKLVMNIQSYSKDFLILTALW